MSFQLLTRLAMSKAAGDPAEEPEKKRVYLDKEHFRGG
jgi:hypothetical protein